MRNVATLLYGQVLIWRVRLIFPVDSVDDFVTTHAVWVSQRNRQAVTKIPGTYVQYPGLQGGSELGDASTPGTPAVSIAASAHGGTYGHVAVAGGA